MHLIYSDHHPDVNSPELVSPENPVHRDADNHEGGQIKDESVEEFDDPAKEVAAQPLRRQKPPDLRRRVNEEGHEVRDVQMDSQQIDLRIPGSAAPLTRRFRVSEAL